jgi:small subunit ribosomal protein S6
MNIECDQATLEELESGFRFNDAILRSMTLVRKEAITEPSFIASANAEDTKVAESKSKEVAETETETKETETKETEPKETETVKAKPEDDSSDSE